MLKNIRIIPRIEEEKKETVTFALMLAQFTNR